MVRTILGVNETVSDEKLEEIFEVLTEEFDLFDENGSALYTKPSCLLPMSSNLINMVKHNKSSGALSGNNTNNDVRPGPSNDSRQSVVTTADTASDSGQSVSTKPVPVGRKKDKNRENVTETVQSKLFKIYEKKSRDSKQFPKKMSMLTKNEGHYLVKNAVVTDEVLTRIESIEPSLKGTDISNFLKSMSYLNENEFNELYLFPNVPDGYFVLPGDRIEPNKVELFDLLIHDRRNREKRITYLFQNKKGLDYHTRDACAQIRNSAELLWHDFMCGHKRHIELFWEMVVESTTAPSAYRHFVRERLLTITKQEFLEMFDDDVKLVFVLAFAPKTAKHNQLLKWDFKHITSKTLIESDPKFGSEVHCALKETYILNELGYLTDSFIDMTQLNFQKVCGDHPKLKQLGIQKRNALHSFLKKHGTCDLSTIAKLELLTLDNCFNTFQIGGGGRRFNLQICHINSC
ncbi:frdA [Mytilus edulis]|uniref:SdhA n=1 Tax=Mytilus edulis TaxID=6550 RepID=A0A8S3V7V2_MYTED|nr:frdA [Mytilus edulis]